MKVVLRDATIDDGEWLYHLRNSESVREHSLNREEIDKLAHYKWLIACLESDAHNIKIACVGTERLGVVRSHRQGGVFLSWAVHEGWRGRGVGKSMLKAFLKDNPNTYLALIREDNTPSIKMVEAVGLTLVYNRDNLILYKWEPTND